MSRARVVATAVLAVGAAAAIASSGPTWDLIESQPLPDATLEPASPLVGYRIRVELRGPVEQPRGWVDIDLAGLLPATGEGPESASATVTFTSDAEPDAPTVALLQAGPGAPPLGLSAAVWSDCTTPCVDSFTLWIDRGEVMTPARPLVVSGTITAQTDGVGDAAPAGAEILVVITPIEETP